MTAAPAASPAAAGPPGRPHRHVHAWRRELRTVHAVTAREVLRMTRQPLCTALMMGEPLFMLFALGGGLATFVPDGSLGGGYRTYLFPGVLVMAVQAPALGVGARLIADRAGGRLRETLMAPALRSTLIAGLCLGGTVTAACQSGCLLCLAGLVALPYDPVMLAGMLAALALTAFALTALTIALAVSVRSQETFTVLLGLATTPLLFVSGAFFPLSSLPDWLTPFSVANPLAYAVDLLHHVVRAHTDGTLATGPSWGSWRPNAALESAVLALLGAAALAAAARCLDRPR
jgi:ABC-2 type transport system permease protein